MGVTVLVLMAGMLLLLSTYPPGTESSSRKAVAVRLAAKWPATPLLLEASEFIAEEGNEQFWQFLETVKELTWYKKGALEHSYYNLILKKAGQFLSNVQINLLKFSLSLRAYSPTVQMFQQIAADEPPPKGCSAFVVIHGKSTCKANEIMKLLKKAAARPKPYLFKGDHKFPALSETGPVVILYAEMGTKDFATFHKVLSEKAQKEEIVYVLRHFVQKPSSEKMYLSGYGVELAIKSTEYKVVDDSQAKAKSNVTEEELNKENEVQGFLFDTLKQNYPDLKDNLKELRKYLIESTDDTEPLKVWELQDLSLQAASRILSVPSYNALKVMKDIAQNFPVKARSLSRVSVNLQMRKEIKENQQHLQEALELQPGETHLFLNGLHIDLDFQDPFSLLETLKLEEKAMHGLHSLGIKGDVLGKIMRLDAHSDDNTYALDIRHSSIIWINNLEKDVMYDKWPTSFQELLKPAYAGMMRQIRRNLYNLVIFIDPVQEEAADFMKLVEVIYTQKVPIRIGFVFVLNTDELVDGNKDAGTALWRAFNYVADEMDIPQAFAAIMNMYDEVKDSGILSVGHVKRVLVRAFPHADLQDILGIHSDYDEKRQAGAVFYKKTRLGPLPQALFNGVPFNRKEMNVGELQTSLLKIVDATESFQRAVFMGLLNDHTDAVDFIMEQQNVVSHIHDKILATEKRYLNFVSPSVPIDTNDFSTFPFLDSQDKTFVVSENMKYVTRKDEDVIYPVTIWIIADCDKPDGRQLLSNALKYLKTSSHVQIGIVNNPASKIIEDNTVIARAVLAAFLTQKNTSLKNFLSRILKEEMAKTVPTGTSIKKFLVPGMDDDAFEKKYNTLGVDIIQAHQLFCREVLKLLPGQMAVVSNGRVIGPLHENEFSPEDFDLLEQVTLSKAAVKIKTLVKEMGIDSKRGSNLVMKVNALLSSLPKIDVRRDIEFLKEKHSVLKVDPPQKNEPFFDIVGIVDPVTREAQKLSHLLTILGQIVNMRLRLFMNCRSKLSEVPLKSFYRFVLEPELVSGTNSFFPLAPGANFLEMPESPLLTLNMITPESWLVAAVNSSYDLDNIHLKDVEGVVSAEYELEYLLLEGQCFDVTTRQPPRGLQFTLGTRNNPVKVDTIVMANLGYFQLKANPGAWILRLREGRSEEIYQIFKHEGTDSSEVLEEVIVVLNSFRSKIIKVQIQKKPDEINEDLLSDGATEEEEDFMTSVTGGTQIAEKDKKMDVLNIFSVASGHLYERFLRIMMLSVLRHTKTPVKFWFLKNYLSPTFKKVIPYMANKYGFQYELVQYKWPRWLHQQTEKQRIIWGYKILFLDVLFPLAVDKIIFVDADQIVRSDLKELRDIDMKGAPYGYTPFCDSRTEMDGYRFWKSGYWASHLGKRKYHISALYVVDLKRFRKIAAGDRLRGQYQALSKDPNSLSNLDQDLPNNMIHQVSIKSLPQEWLWCETWCSDESKKKAKTIDLCNNPKTKEPKLEAAVRIVPEWTEYDSEIQKLIAQIRTEKIKMVQSHHKDSKHDEL
ncbi:UDP-glucose:glycoprotein glucosyltransferase 2 isoform X2 [Rhineura floridana]|uniref:UDP-glucose:glycoprotein glucosyltransferase 2 isoform X2 n=1 Tax=Rhineura floridana TaxID=261503 RepID=UPI002AC8405A|nr:UDP-glucose:glycoprotein glucosyltransferase 2 isoform X2 [Rhineura floridana]